MTNQVVSTLRCTLARLGLAVSAVLLAALYLFALSPSPSEAATSVPHTSATCTQAAPFPYGSAVVGIAATPDDGGYWIVTNEGYVAACGDAPYLGEQTTLNAPIVGIAATPNGGGYYLVASDGGVFTFGKAQFYGSTGAIHLNKPVVGMTVDPITGGYWLVASDGGIFAFNAPFLGSTGSMTLNKPVVGMAAASNGDGYWLVATDGGIFAYGVPFWGSTGSIHLNKPVVGMAADAASLGYWLVASDGGIFAYNAPFYGSTGNIVLNAPIVGMEATPSGSGYRFIASDGGVFDYGTSGFYGTPVFAPMSVQLFGDSVALTLGVGLSQPSVEQKYDFVLSDEAILGCGVVNGPEVDLLGAVYPTPSACNGSPLTTGEPPDNQPWPYQWLMDLNEVHPDVAVLLAGRWEVVDREYQGQWTNILNPQFATYVKGQLEEASQLVTATGAQMVFLTAPCTDEGEQPDGAPWPEDDPARLAVYNTLVREVAAEHPLTDSVVDLDAAACPNGTYTSTVDGVAIRDTDGVHFTDAGGEVLAPAIIPGIIAAGRAQMAQAAQAPSVPSPSVPPLTVP